jgi:hypothetical protein
MILRFEPNLLYEPRFEVFGVISFRKSVVGSVRPIQDLPTQVIEMYEKTRYVFGPKDLGYERRSKLVLGNGAQRFEVYERIMFQDQVCVFVVRVPPAKQLASAWHLDVSHVRGDVPFQTT